MAAPQYGYRHRLARKRWNDWLTINGPIPCRRCGAPIHCDSQAARNSDGRPFQLGHGLAHALGGDGTDSQPECTRCNERAGGLLAQAKRRAPRVSRRWR